MTLQSHCDIQEELLQNGFLHLLANRTRMITIFMDINFYDSILTYMIFNNSNNVLFIILVIILSFPIEFVRAHAIKKWNETKTEIIPIN